jgi:hypothetical protein
LTNQTSKIELLKKRIDLMKFRITIYKNVYGVDYPHRESIERQLLLLEFELMLEDEDGRV